MRLVFLLCLIPCALFAQTPRPVPVPPAAPVPDLKTLSGKTYKQARVFRVEPDGINYMYAGGMVKVPFTDLPEAVRKQHGYDAKAAAHFAAQDDAIQDAAYRASQAQLAAQALQAQHALEQAGQNATAEPFRGEKERLPGEPEAIVNPNWQGGLKTLAKLRVDQVVASPFSLKGALIEMGDIDRVEPKEISEGVYQLTIWGRHGVAACVEATLPAGRASIAEQCTTLFVAVKDPKAYPIQVSVLGNGTTYQGLSTMPTVIWK